MYIDPPSFILTYKLTPPLHPPCSSYYFFPYKVDLTPKEYEALGMVVDANLTSEIGMGEFVTFLAVLKHMENRARNDDVFSNRIFKMELSNNKELAGNKEENHEEDKMESKIESSRDEDDDDDEDFGTHLTRSLRHTSNSFREGSIWDKAMLQVNHEVLKTGWDAILRAINGIEIPPVTAEKKKLGDLFKGKNKHGGKQSSATVEDIPLPYDPNSILSQKIAILFNKVDSDGSGGMDIHELGKGLEACDIFLNEKQINALANAMDVDGDGMVTLPEFQTQIHNMKLHRENEIEKEDMDLMTKAIMKNEIKKEREEDLLRDAKIKEANKITTTGNDEDDGGKSNRKLPNMPKMLTKTASIIYDENIKSRSEKLSIIRDLVERKTNLMKTIASLQNEIKELKPDENIQSK